MVELILGLGVLGVALVFGNKINQVAMKQSQKMGVGGDLRSSNKAMLVRTGYRYAALKDAPLDAHIEHALKLAEQPYTKIHMVREWQGYTLNFEQETRQTGAGFSMSAQWWLKAKTNTVLQVADRSLASALKQAFSGVERNFRPQYTQEVELSMPQVRKRFRAWSPDPTSAKRILDQQAVQSQLQHLPEVDVVMDGEVVSLSDPLMKVLAGPKHTARAMLAMTPEQRLEALVIGHDRACNCLLAFIEAAG